MADHPPETAPRQKCTQNPGSAPSEDTPRAGAHASAGDTTASFKPEEASSDLVPTPPTTEELPAELMNHPRYALLEKLGEGGMGTVYKARHRLMGRTVALKVIRSPLVEQPEMVARFQREIRAAHLSHPNIVAAYDAETSGALHFLVMEYVKGINLADVIAREGTLPVVRACDCARQAALGLQYAFSRGMVHRDIKPHNLIRTAAEDGEAEVVKVLDFGLARFIQETQAPVGDGTSGPPEAKARPPAGQRTDAGTCPLTLVGTAPGSLMGTSNYMAPEQAADPRSADIRADIYSLGCTLYHLLTGRPPFGGLPEEDKLVAHRSLMPRPVTACRADVPAELERIVERMLAKDPAQRYQTPAEVAAALTPFVVAQPPVVETPAPRRTYGRRRTSVLIMGVLLGAAIATGALALSRHFFPPPHSDGHEKDGHRTDNADVPLVKLATLCFEGHTEPVSGVAYSRDGRLLLSGSYDGTLRAWEARTGRNLHVFHGHTGKVRGVALSANGQIALSASEDRTARVWNVASGQEVGCFRGHSRPVTCVALSADGKYALSASEKTMRWWEVATAREVRSFPRGAESVAFSPDGRRVVFGGWDKIVFLWDLDGSRKLRAFRGHKKGIKSVTFTPDGKQILSGSEDCTLVLWDIASGKIVRRWWAHQHWVWDVAFSSDGHRILSTGWDRTARLWDAATGRELQVFAPDAEEMLCGAIAPDGRSAVCGCADGVIRLWRLPP